MITALLIAVVFVVAVVVVLVIGLLRSYSEILEALEVVNRKARGGPSGLADGLLPSRDRTASQDAASVIGVTVRGDHVNLALAAGGPNTLLAFLTSGCSTCQHFWDAFQTEQRGVLPGGARLLIITKDSSEESPSRLAKLSPSDIPVVMSSAAWKVYDIASAPYFVYVDGVSGKVHGEGAAVGWSQVRSLLTDALYDADVAAGRAPSNPQGESTAERNERADAALAAAGIAPDDPSMWDPTTPGETGLA